MTDAYNPYDHELERVGVKEHLLDSIAEGYYEEVKYDDKPDYWKAEGISREEFDAAQALWVKNKFGERIHAVLYQGKP